MRAVGLTDLDLAARAVMMRDPQDWPDCARQLIAQAHAADLWRKRMGTIHPSGGTGSLYAQAALCRPSPQPLRCEQSYCAALGVVLAALQDWRARAASGAPQRDY